MFDTRPTTINGQTVELLWIKEDILCYNYILADWQEFHPRNAKFIRDNGTVIQAGGNCGLYSLLYASDDRCSRVYTFEPDPINFYCLAHNCKSNKIVKFNTAVGNKCELLTIGVVDKTNVGMHKIGSGSTVVHSVTIDSINIEDVSLIHLDVEGYEYNALLGATSTIKKFRPTIIVEVSHDLKHIEDFMLSIQYIQVAEYGKPINKVYVPKEMI